MGDETKKPKRAKNLLLDPEAVSRGERYSRRHGTNLSRLVSDYLRALPLGGDELPLSPVVRRLWGVARAGKDDKETYRAHLTRKYGGR
jgi:hypothetical protein